MICDVAATAVQEPDRPGLDDQAACPVDQARALMAGSAASSCGRDVFCREGTRQVHTILEDLAAGRGESGDLELVEELCRLTADNVACPMAATWAELTVELLRDQREEWELHLRRRRCSSLTCPASFTVYIAPDACIGCGRCVSACPEKAVVGGEDLIHVVLTDACTKCLDCLPVCPVNAIGKAGPVKPKVPTAPVPVGSFATAGAAGTRRRRRREA